MSNHTRRYLNGQEERVGPWSWLTKPIRPTCRGRFERSQSAGYLYWAASITLR